jgi:hypothetical protein
MTNRSIGPLLCGGLLLAVLTPAAAPAAPTVVTCSPTKMKVVASDPTIQSQTTSATFANIPQTKVGFTQGAAGGCVIVRFSAQTSATLNATLIIRAFLDNANAALAAKVAYTDNNGGVGAHSYEFIFPSVIPGPHTVRMQFRSLTGIAAVVVRQNTVVQFAP